MPRYSGKAGQVWLDVGQPTQDDRILGVTSWDLELKGDAIDVTGMDNAGIKEFIPAATEGTASIEAFADGELDPDIKEGAVLGCCLIASAWDTHGWIGSGVLSSKRPTVQVDGAVKWTLSLQFSGTINYEEI